MNIEKKMYFLAVEERSQSIILDWFKKEHVKEFYYGEGLQNTLDNIQLYCQGINNNGRYAFEHWIAFLEDEPFGFLITSLINGPYDANNNYNRWYIDGKNTFTLDLLIG